MFDPIMYAMMKKNGGGLPVVELSTLYKAENGIPAEDAAPFTAAINSKVLIVAQKSSEDEPFITPALCLRHEIDGFIAFFGCCGTEYRGYIYDPETGVWFMGS